MTSIVFVSEKDYFKLAALQWKLFHIAMCSLPVHAWLFYYCGTAYMRGWNDPGVWISKSNGPGVFFSPDLHC